MVGIHYLDLYLVSHTPGETSYFYQYQPETYEAFVAEQTAYKTEVDAVEADRHRPASLVLKTTPEGEKALLRDLFAQYPANNYRSYSYDRDIADHLNGKLIRGALALNTLTGLALGGLFVLVNRKRRALYETEAVSFDNYYLTRRVTSRVIGLSELALHVLLFLGFVLISPMVLTYEAEVMVTCLNFGLLLAVVSLPAVVGLVKKHG